MQKLGIVLKEVLNTELLPHGVIAINAVVVKRGASHRTLELWDSNINVTKDENPEKSLRMVKANFKSKEYFTLTAILWTLSTVGIVWCECKCSTSREIAF